MNTKEKQKGMRSLKQNNDILRKESMEKNMNNRKKQIGKIKSLIRDAYFVPETMGIDDVLKKMQADKVHMGIVIDEYGQTAGIISMEDIIEEIVGNILDEYDEDDD